MGLCFKIYDTPYWTEASSLTHPSIQPPESASNAHHVLMNMINLCAGSLWTPFSSPTPNKTSNRCFRSSNVLTSIKPTPAFLYKQKQNNSPSLELHKQTVEQHSSEQSTAQHHSGWKGDRRCALRPIRLHLNSSALQISFYSHICAPLYCVQECWGGKKSVLALFNYTFLNQPVKRMFALF